MTTTIAFLVARVNYSPESIAHLQEKVKKKRLKNECAMLLLKRRYITAGITIFMDLHEANEYPSVALTNKGQ